MGWKSCSFYKESFHKVTKRFDFLGVKFNAINQKDAFHFVKTLKGGNGYICFPDTSVVSFASKDSLLLEILNKSILTLPDGKPSEIVAKLQGFKNVSTVSGFNLCKSLLDTDLSHYFYGGDDALLENLSNQLKLEFPNVSIAGMKSPPFVGLEGIENNVQIHSDIQEIASLKPSFVWIGISSPKQDYLMHYFNSYLPSSIMLGVGGVFLYLANPTMKSPEWIKKIGFRWLYRLLKEPGRLGGKYLSTFLFMFKNFPYFFSLFIKKVI